MPYPVPANRCTNEGTAPLWRVVTKSLNETGGMSAPDLKVLHDIRGVGWHVVRVFSREPEGGPEWAFSVGMFHSFMHPEVIIFGLPLDRCMAIVNEIGRAVQSGSSFASGKDYAEILEHPYKCAFRDVRRIFYRDYVGYALWFYEKDPFPLLQCFWPDKEGKFPWDAGCADYVKNVQPLLFAT